MLTYNETMGMILSLERSIKNAEAEYERSGSIDQKDYAEHCKRLLAAYIVEHRKAARKDGEYSMR